MDAERNAFFVTLPNRALIRIIGPDRRAFLDALVSNDLTLLDRQDSVYACLLTPQGKFLYDFIVFEDGETLILDCEGGERAEALLKKLKLYKLRSKVDLDLTASVPIFSLPPACGRGENEGGAGGYSDSRHPLLGKRSLVKPDFEERPFSIWDSLRIRLAIPDGSRDMVPEQSTLIESNIDRLNGISFDKGCYVGQELTARMHHRGLAKKHLYAVEWPGEPPAPGTDIVVGGHLIGQARSSCGRNGLAVLKDESMILPNLPFILPTS